MDASTDDTQDFKHRMREQWDAAAAGWDAHAHDIGAWLREPTRAMCHMAGVRPDAQVLDVAAGAGDQTMLIAGQVGPRGRVLATDLSPAILALAQRNAARAGLDQVDTLVADGEHLGVAEASFDAAVCRLGLMLFPDPLGGLRQMHRALRPGGGVCTMVFSRPEANPCIAITLATACRHAGLPPRDPFAPGTLMSLGRPGHLDALFREAGFEDVATTAVDALFRQPSVDHYLAFLRRSAGPVRQILAGLDAAAADAAWQEMRERLDVFSTPHGWAGPNELLLTAGRRPSETT